MDSFSLSHLASMRPTSDALFPVFVKPSGGGSKNMSREGKRDSRNAMPSGKFWKFYLNSHSEIITL